MLLSRPDALQAYCKQYVEKEVPCFIIWLILQKHLKKNFHAYVIRNLML